MAPVSLNPAPRTRVGAPPGARLRDRMINELAERRGIRDRDVLEAMRNLPRHLFVEEALAGHAYGDATLPIGAGQTLSQPYTVARMTEALMLTGCEDVLEIGTGSGYQTAVLAQLCRRVYTIERVPELAETARQRLRELGIRNVTFRIGDGSLGWPQSRRFDRIIVTAGAPATPQALTAQLAPGGIMIVPEGDRRAQNLVLHHAKARGGRQVLENCRFVPLLGAQGW